MRYGHLDDLLERLHTRNGHDRHNLGQHTRGPIDRYEIPLPFVLVLMRAL